MFELATGGTPVVAQPVEPVGAFEYPDARRRFRLVSDVEELRQALDYPWEKWIVFLHPAQRELVERNYNGPARVGHNTRELREHSLPTLYSREVRMVGK